MFDKRKLKSFSIAVILIGTLAFVAAIPGSIGRYWQVMTARLGTITYAAEDFNFKASPSGSLVVGSNVVSLSSCPAGLSTFDHNVYIDTVGTPEVVKLTAVSCVPGSSGTITFTVANTHGTGYRIRSATNGYKEASEYAKITLTGPAATSAYGVMITPPKDGAEIRGTLYIEASHQVVDFSGSYLRCYAAPCVFVGSSVATAYQDITIKGVSCQPQADFTTTVGTTGAACIEDNAQSTRMIAPIVRNPAITFPGVGYSAFYSIVQIDDDEGAVIEDMYISAGSSRFGRCDTTLCSVVINIIGGSNFGILELRHANFTLFNSNGVDNQGGNTLNIVDSVIQSQYQFAVRTKGTNVNIAGNVSGWYGESTGFQNPNGTGTAGIIYQGSGWGTLRNSILQGGLPSYARSNTGSTRFTYFVQTVSSTFGSGPWLPAGYCLTNATGTCNVKWPPIGTAGTITYNVARCLSAPGSGTCPTSLYTDVIVGGSANAVGTVATGLTPAGNCTGTATNGSCLLVDDVTASTSAGTGSLFPTYCPAIPFWPGYAVISNFSDAACGNTPMRLFIDELGGATDSPLISGFGAGAPTVIAQHAQTQSGGGGGSGSPVWMETLANGVAFGGTVQGALVFQNAPLNNTGGDMTGRIGFINSQTNNSVRGCLYNLVYANREAVLATNGNRVANTAGNNCIGPDVGGTPANTGIGIQVGASWSVYVNQAFDGTNWLERITATAKTFKVPVTLATITGSTQCLQVNSSGVISGTGSACGSGGGGATWGSITGTLSSQTDLQTALNLKAPLASPTFTGTVTMPGPTFNNITGITQCLQVNSSGVVSGAGAACGIGGSGTPGIKSMSTYGSAALALAALTPGDTLIVDGSFSLCNGVPAAANVTITSGYQGGTLSCGTANSSVLHISTNAIEVANLNIKHTINPTSGGDGILVDGGLTSTNIHHNLIQLNYNGANLGDTSNSRFDKNYVQLNNNDGVHGTPSSSRPVNQWYLDGNLSQKNLGWGYRWEIPSGFTGVQMTAPWVSGWNQSFGNSLGGLAIIGSGATTSGIGDLWVSGFFSSQDNGTGIYIDAGPAGGRNIIIGNFYVEQAGTYNGVAGFSSTVQSPTNAGYGLFVTSSCDSTPGPVISNGTVWFNSDSGIRTDCPGTSINNVNAFKNGVALSANSYQRSAIAIRASNVGVTGGYFRDSSSTMINGIDISNSANTPSIMGVVCDSTVATCVNTSTFPASGFQQTIGNRKDVYGSGTPSISCSNGDMYHRTDAGNFSTLYACRNGAWGAIN